MPKKIISIVLLIGVIGLTIHDLWLAETHVFNIKLNEYIKSTDKPDNLAEAQKAFFEFHKELHKPVLVELSIFTPKFSIDNFYSFDYLFSIPKPSPLDIFKPPSFLI